MGINKNKFTSYKCAELIAKLHAAHPLTTEAPTFQAAALPLLATAPTAAHTTTATPPPHTTAATITGAATLTATVTDILITVATHPIILATTTATHPMDTTVEDAAERFAV